MSNAIGGDPSYSRVTMTGGWSYKFVVLGYNATDRVTLPEIKEIFPSYGSTEFYAADAQIQINFGGETIYPAQRNTAEGKIAIYRGAVGYNGELVMINTDVLFQETDLNETDGLTNGNLVCTVSGTCNITLSTATSTALQKGEIYFLSLFPDSFSNLLPNSYLFSNNTNGGLPLYTSAFFYRSFTINSSPTTPVFSSSILPYPADQSNP